MCLSTQPDMLSQTNHGDFDSPTPSPTQSRSHPRHDTTRHDARQVVAWEDKDASSLSASAYSPNTATSPSCSGSGSSSSNSVLRYGVVVAAGGGAGEAGGGGEGAGGGDEEDFDGGGGGGGGRGSGRVGGGLRHVRVKLTPGRVDTLLSSQVCACVRVC